MSKKSDNELYKPFKWNIILALCLILLSTIVLIAIFFCRSNCLFYRLVELIADSEKKLSCDDISLITFSVIVIIDYLVVCTILTIIIIKDDCGIRFAKLNELARIENKINISMSETNSISKSTAIANESNKQIIDSTCKLFDKNEKSKYTNLGLDFYKKYMDSIVEL